MFRCKVYIERYNNMLYNISDNLNVISIIKGKYKI